MKCLMLSVSRGHKGLLPFYRRIKEKSTVSNGCPMWYIEDADTNEILG